MNILIPDQWLREYLDTPATPDQIRTNLSLCGPSVERIETIADDQVYDIEITTNRVDCMSLLGLAREAAVILNQFDLPSRLLDPTRELNQQFSSLTPTQSLPLPTINYQVDEQVCRRVMAAVLEVQVTPTPDFMAQRLRQIDGNVHHALIDITNYITHELGHPCHAFDYDKIMQLDGEINITLAQPGQRFITLDGEEHLTVGGEVVFINPAGEIIDLPAVKGTANTAVDENTTRLLFWVENLAPEKVRYASMSHAIRTTAAVLNEKNVDPYLAQTVFYRGLQLFQTHCQGQLASAIYDYFPQPPTLNSLIVPWSIFPQYLGIDLPRSQIKTILTDLGLQIAEDKADGFQVEIPSWRPDLTIPADIVEEVARIYGYHNLPSRLDFATTAIPAQPEYNFTVESQIKTQLAAFGYQEIYQYSMTSEQLASWASLPLNQQLKINNPLTDDRVYLRPDLLPSLFEVYQANSGQQQQKQKPELNFFELAQIYRPDVNIDQVQATQLAMLSNRPYRAFRADLEASLAKFFLTNIKISPLTDDEIPSTAKLNLPGLTQTAALTATDRRGTQLTTLGYLYEIIDFDQVLFGVQIDINALVSVASNYPHYQPLAVYPSITEDLTFRIDQSKSLELGKIIDQIKQPSKLITKVELKEIYQDRYTFSLTYNSPQQPLSNAEIAPVRQQIVTDLIAKFPQISLVGELTT